MRYYLLQSKINGIKSINKEITIDYYNNTVSKELDIMNNHVKAIYGPNGAGKTGIICAMDIYKNICIDSSYLTIANSNGYLRNLINQNNELLLENTFAVLNDDNIVDGIYKHKIVLSYINNQFEISKEYFGKLSGNKINLLDKYSTIFNIENGNIVELLNNLNDSNKLIETTKNLLKFKSFLSVFNDSLANNIRHDLNKVFYNSILALTGFNMSLNIVLQNNIDKDKYLKRIKKCELDSYKQKIKSLADFIKVFRVDLKDIEIKVSENEIDYECEAIMVYDNGSKVNLRFESIGIKKIVKLYDALRIVDRGSIVFIDDLDSNMHDILLNKIVEYILNYSKGQFIFTIHNMSPMDLLQYKKHSIDFLSLDSRIVSWVKNGNYKAQSLYRQGYIEYSPFNIEAFSFLGKFGDGN